MPLPARAPHRRLHLAAARSHRGRAGRRSRGRLLELAEVFERRWREALDGRDRGCAAGGCALPPRRRALASAGRAPRTACSRPASVRAPIYAAIVREKLSWIGVPSQALLLAHGDPRRVKAFLHAHDLFLLGLQADRRRGRRGPGSRAARRRRSDRALLLAGGAGAGGAEAGAAGRRRRPRTGGFTLVRHWLDALRGRDHLLAPRRRSARRRAGRHRHRGRDRGRRHERGDGPRPAASVAAAIGRTRLSADRGLRTGARMERAPVRCPSAGTRGGRSFARPAPPPRRGGRWRASARSISTWRRRGASTTRRRCPSTPVCRAASAAAAAAATTPAWTGTSRPARSSSPTAAVAAGASVSVARRPRGRLGRRSASRSSTSRSTSSPRCRRPSKDRFASACPVTTTSTPHRRGRRSRPVTARRWRASCWRSVRARTSGCSRSPAWPGAARPYLAPADLAAAVAAAVGDLAGRRRPHRDERRRLGDAALSARRAARGGALRPARAGHVDLLLGRRSVAQPRPPGRQRRAGRRRPRQPALGAGDRRRATARAAGIASIPGTTAPAGRGQRERRRGATYNRLGPAVALAALG